ncbi:MAG: hypothetical protein JSW07_22305 [bacterium]|nr:MAG: hypothetical protein JSW07_22305 [bacterium]
MNVIKNRDLFNGNLDNLPDNLFVLTYPPEKKADYILIAIDLDREVAVLDKHFTQYPDQPTVSQIRNGDGSSWLLAGGTLITDHENRIAVGLRDGNAADPFTFTNIGAGRCDQKLEDHCFEEMASEFIVCVKKEDNLWHQFDFGQHTTLLKNLNKPDIRKKRDFLLKNFGSNISPPDILQNTIHTKLNNNLNIKWIDKDKSLIEYLKGYVLLDEENKTTEFRLGLNINLSKYSEAIIFFGEGTGHAEWMSLDQIKTLIQAEIIADRKFVTPFLRAL